MSATAIKKNPSPDLIEAAEELLSQRRAQDHLLPFILKTMPDPNNPDDPDASRFQVEPHHKLLCEALEKVEKGECLRLAISMPPQHGKSETASRRFPAWFMGKHPYKNLMFGTYNQDFANNFGDQVRQIMRQTEYKRIFPNSNLRKGSQAKDEMFTTDGGQMSFLGRGGSGTGKPADIFLIDDPLKDAKEAESPTIRNDLWEWFTKVVYTRCHVASAIVIIHTRWHEDDLIGRLCDPSNPNYDPEIGKDWLYINIPAIMNDDGIAKALGKKKGDALWPSRFPVSHLETAKRLNPRGFESLYQGKPAPDDGDYFKVAWMKEYDAHDLPKNLRIYAASDHAVTVKLENDPVCMGCVGVDEHDHIWVLPDLVWERMETDETVENMLAIMRARKPMIWWAEDDVIRKAIGPFLRKRMIETKTYCTIDPQRPIRDKKARARSVQGRMSMGMVHFPRFAPWWQDARSEMLKFPNATHDDFVDWLAWIGLGLDREVGASKAPREDDNIVRVGSIAWIKASSQARKREQDRHKAAAGF